jgi:hypothetical protein
MSWLRTRANWAERYSGLVYELISTLYLRPNRPPEIIKIGYSQGGVIFESPPGWGDLNDKNNFPSMPLYQLQSLYQHRPDLKFMRMWKMCPHCGYNRVVLKGICTSCGPINRCSTLAPHHSLPGFDVLRSTD